jgi:hypothetical protein
MAGRKPLTEEEKKVQDEKKKFCKLIGKPIKDYPSEVEKRIEMLVNKKEEYNSLISAIDQQLVIENQIYENQNLIKLKESILKLSPEAQKEIKESINL